MKRVKQISLDVLVDAAIDGNDLSEEIAEALESLGFIVLGSDFQDDLTDAYKEYFPEILEDKVIMKKIYCPKCGKELIRLEPYEEGVYEFWCDDCNIDIVVGENEED